eukprot:jgi/Mesvir1/5907/Mv00677-RA.1
MNIKSAVFRRIGRWLPWITVAWVIGMLAYTNRPKDSRPVNPEELLPSIPADGSGKLGLHSRGAEWGALATNRPPPGLHVQGHMWCYDKATFSYLPELIKTNRSVPPDGCMCETGYTSVDCAIPVCRKPCLQGRCSHPNRCDCLPGWVGKQCEEPVCAAKPGCGHGKCVAPNVCSCDEGFYGKFCHIRCINGVYIPDPPGHGRGQGIYCGCHHGWHGTECDIPECRLHGCENGICEAPDKCNCEAGYGGVDCRKDLMLPLARDLMQGLRVKDRRFSSVALNAMSAPDTWQHLRAWTSNLPRQYVANKLKMVNAVPLNDTVVGFHKALAGGGLETSLQGAYSGSNPAERWQRCAVVGDSAGLLHTELGVIIDKHEAVMRFNMAPVFKFERHVGMKTTYRMMNRRSTYATLQRAIAASAMDEAAAPVPKKGTKGEEKVAVEDLSGMMIFWHPESYHMYPELRKRLPMEQHVVLRSDFLESVVQLYLALLRRMLESGLLARMRYPGVGSSSKGGAGGAAAAAARASLSGQRGGAGANMPTIDGDVLDAAVHLHIPTSFVGIMLMTQLCRTVHLFGFDPPAVRSKLREWGISQQIYYDNPVQVENAREDGDTLFGGGKGAGDFVADDDSVNEEEVAEGSAEEKLLEEVKPVTEAEEEDGEEADTGEIYPGAGGKGGFLYALLRLLHVQGYIRLCTTEAPEACVK